MDRWDSLFNCFYFFMIRVTSANHVWDDERWWDPIPLCSRNVVETIEKGKYSNPKVVFIESGLKFVDSYLRVRVALELSKAERRKMAKSKQWPKESLKIYEDLIKKVTND